MAASPEQFLREFATEIMSQAWKYGSEAKLEATIKGWAKLLKLREDAARLNEAKQNLQPYTYRMPIKSVRNRNTAFKLYAVKFFNGKVKERLERRIAQLTTPNNTSNTPKEGA